MNLWQVRSDLRTTTHTAAGISRRIQRGGYDAICSHAPNLHPSFYLIQDKKKHSPWFVSVKGTVDV